MHDSRTAGFNEGKMGEWLMGGSLICTSTEHGENLEPAILFRNMHVAITAFSHFTNPNFDFL